MFAENEWVLSHMRIRGSIMYINGLNILFFILVKICSLYIVILVKREVFVVAKLLYNYNCPSETFFGRNILFKINIFVSLN